jgi:hypothetical protein
MQASRIVVLLPILLSSISNPSIGLRQISRAVVAVVRLAHTALPPALHSLAHAHPLELAQDR